MFKLDLEKAEESEIKLRTSIGSQKKQENSRKTSTSISLAMLKPLTVWITTSCGKFFKRWEYQTTLPASWEICMQVKKQVRTRQKTRNWIQIGKGVCQGYILSTCLFNLYAEYIIQNAKLDDSQDGIKIVGRNINNFRYAEGLRHSVRHVWAHYSAQLHYFLSCTFWPLGPVSRGHTQGVFPQDPRMFQTVRGSLAVARSHIMLYLLLTVKTLLER